jgi:hypothetical protein
LCIALIMLWRPAVDESLSLCDRLHLSTHMPCRCSEEQGEHLAEELDPHGEEGSGDYDPDDLTHEEEDLHDLHRYVMRSASECEWCGL